jgi:hypothetical protein
VKRTCVPRTNFFRFPSRKSAEEYPINFTVSSPTGRIHRSGSLDLKHKKGSTGAKRRAQGRPSVTQVRSEGIRHSFSCTRVHLTPRIEKPSVAGVKSHVVNLWGLGGPGRFPGYQCASESRIARKIQLVKHNPTQFLQLAHRRTRLGRVLHIPHVDN